jgi:hypothetical protein
MSKETAPLVLVSCFLFCGCYKSAPYTDAADPLPRVYNNQEIDISALPKPRRMMMAPEPDSGHDHAQPAAPSSPDTGPNEPSRPEEKKTSSETPTRSDQTEPPTQNEPRSEP